MEYTAHIKGWQSTVEADSLLEARSEAQELFEHDTTIDPTFQEIIIEDTTTDIEV